jgi:hydrogenase maturation protease
VNSPMNLREQLEWELQGRVCLMGMGNSGYGDDGFGVQLAEELEDAGVPYVVVAGASPERYIGIAVDEGFDHLVFVDAVELGGEPGSAVFLNANEIESRFPQISTHKISMSMLAKVVESNGITKAWLLGVQPGCIREGQGISPKVRATMDVLRGLLLRMKTKDVPVC